MNTPATGLLLAAATLLCTGSALAEEHHPHHHFPQDINAFHSLLAPVWHAAPGKERTRDACAKAGEMQQQASTLRAPGAKALQDSVTGLQQQCQSDPDNIDAALSRVHDAFHGLIDAGTGKGRR